MVETALLEFLQPHQSAAQFSVSLSPHPQAAIVGFAAKLAEIANCDALEVPGKIAVSKFFTTLHSASQKMT